MRRLTVILWAGLVLSLAGCAHGGWRGLGEAPARIIGTENGKALVQFRFREVGATSVYLLGSFNNFHAPPTLNASQGTIPLTRDAEGTWSVTYPLAPGRWLYYYSTDRRLVRDLANPLRQLETHCCDGYISILYIRDDFTLSFDRKEAKGD